MKSFKDYVMNEKASVKKGFGLKVGDVILYGREGIPHEVTGKPKPDGPIYSVDVLNLSRKKKDKIYFDSSDIFIMAEKDSLDEAKMYKSEYLSDSDVRYIMQAVGVSWRNFERLVKDAIQQYLEMTLENVQIITVTRANIGGYMFSVGATRLLVNEILYEFRLDGESHQGAIKKQEIWVNL